MYFAQLIEEFPKQTAWKTYNFVKGIYAIRIMRGSLRGGYTHEHPSYISCQDNKAPWNFDINLDRDASKLVNAMRINNVTFDDESCTIIGRFDKRGRELYFTPETGKHYANLFN